MITKGYRFSLIFSFCLAALLPTMAALPNHIGTEPAQLFKVISPLGKTLPASLVGKVKQVILLQPNQIAWRKLMQQRPSQLQLNINNIDQKGRRLMLDLKAAKLTRPNFGVTTASKAKVSQDAGLCFQGQVRAAGEPIERYQSTLAALTVFDNEIYGQFATSDGNYNLGVLKGQTIKDDSGHIQPVYVLYNDRDIIQRHDLRCGADADIPHYAEGVAKLRKVLAPQLNGLPQTKRVANACRTVSIGVETDYALYQRYNNDTNAVRRFAIALFNLVQQQYLNEGVTIGLQSLLIWDRLDPYADLNSGAQLTTFQQLKGGQTPADLVHLLSGLDLNQTTAGGIAYLNAVCSNFNVGLSIVSNNLAPLPIYTWNSSVVSHELGHNFGSLHTHNCSWPTAGGGTGPIDTCANVEGGCYQGPIKPVIGTIMSYCHLLASIDLTLGFGPLPGLVLRDTYANAPCLVGDRAPFYTFTTNSPVCDGDPVSVSIDSAGVGIIWRWTGPNGFTATGPSFSITRAAKLDAGTYSLTADINGCTTSTRSIVIDVNCFPAVDNSYNKAYCEGDSITVAVNNIGNAPNTSPFSLLIRPTNLTSPPITTIGIGSVIGNQIILKGRIPNATSSKYNLFVSDGQKIGQINQDSIQITNALTAISYDTVGCIGSPITLGVRQVTTTNDRYQWYTSTSASTSVFTGNAFRTPSLTDTTTYYLSRGSQRLLKAGLDTSSGGNFRQRYTRGLLFRVLSPIRLNSFEILTDNGGIFMFNIKRREYPTQKDIVYSSTDTTLTTAGVHLIRAGVTLQPGQYYIDADGSTGMGLWRILNGIKFPYTVPNVLSILTGSFMPDNNDVYFYFYNWSVTSLGCESARVPIKVNTIAPLSKPTITNTNGTLSAGPSLRTEWFTTTGTIPFATSPTIPAQTGVRAKVYAQGCGSDYSTPYILTGLNAALSSGIRMYPNPATNQITLTWPNNLQPTHVSIMDAIGRQVWQQQVTGQDQMTMQLALPTGVYAVRVDGVTVRLVVE